MAKNKKLDPALAETVERVLEDLMNRFEAAEERLESRTDLPKISAETEANLLRDIEADLDLYYRRNTQQAADRAKPIEETVKEMATWLRVSGPDMLNRIAELVLPSMPTAAVARSKSAVLNELEAMDGVDEATLRELQFVPIRLDREEPQTNILVLHYFGNGLAPSEAPVLEVRVNGKLTACEIDSNLEGAPPQIEILWKGAHARLDRIGWNSDGALIVFVIST